MIILFCPVIRFTRVDLPTFGLPMTEIFILPELFSRSVVSLIGGQSKLISSISDVTPSPWLAEIGMIFPT